MSRACAHFCLHVAHIFLRRGLCLTAFAESRLSRRREGPLRVPFPPLLARLSRQHRVAAGLAVQVDTLKVAARARDGLPAFVLDLHDDRAEAAGARGREVELQAGPW